MDSSIEETFCSEAETQQTHPEKINLEGIVKLAAFT